MRTQSRLAPAVAALFLAAGMLFCNATAAEPEVTANDLPRVPPTPPEKALSTFKVKPGFHMELVASEPLIASPIALCFDENGRLFVVEMIDYSERRDEHLGRIRMLEDTDGDGRMDKSTIFADQLPWPTALFWSNGGLYVGATPDIYYVKDTNGDGVANEKKLVFTGFGTGVARLNVQQLFNSFTWTLDNRIQGATAGNGGTVYRPADSKGTRLNLHSRDFSFDPRTLEMRAESGGGQYGMGFDNFGRKFNCSNSSHIMQVLYEDRYLESHSLYPAPRPTVEIAVDGGAAEVYRISPDEPWRVLRTKWRVAGLVPGPIEGGGRPSGYFTGATGALIYRGNALPEDYLGDVFVADCGSNLVHHKKLHPNGVEFLAERPSDEQKVEFIASTDNWFRPVQFANAPDGALYVIDMYRETIEHPWSLPPNLKKFLDLNSGNDRGRIYRIVPDGFKQPKAPRLGEATTAELVKTLENPNGWHRDTASRLIYERQDKTAIPLLKQLAHKSKSPYGRLHALYALEGLGALSDDDLLTALQDQNPGVRENAVRLTDLIYGSRPNIPPPLWSRLATHSTDPDVRVRTQLAWSLGILDQKAVSSLLPGRAELLAQILGNASDKWEKTAALVSASAEPAQVWSALSKNPGKDSYPLRQVTWLMGADKNSDPAPLLDAISGKPPREAAPLLVSFNSGLRQRGISLAQLKSEKWKSLLAKAAENARDPRADLSERLDAIALLGIIPSAENASTLAALLTPQNPPEAQIAAVEALAALRQPSAVGLVADRWKSLTPQTREKAIERFSSYPPQLKALLQAVANQKLPAAAFTIAQIAQLRKNADPEIQALSLRIFGKQDTSSRSELIARYADSLRLNGNPAHGKQLYLERCSSCHKLAGEGNPVGPDLESVRQAGKETLLINILDPNREVAPRYVAYDVETKSGDAFTGVIANETTASVLLRGANKLELNLQRDAIIRLENSGKSLMPEGLEQDLTPQDVSDLLEYVMTAKP